MELPAGDVYLVLVAGFPVQRYKLRGQVRSQCEEVPSGDERAEYDLLASLLMIVTTLWVGYTATVVPPGQHQGLNIIE